jgi:hypothetical protein
MGVGTRNSASPRNTRRRVSSGYRARTTAGRVEAVVGTGGVSAPAAGVAVGGERYTGSAACSVALPHDKPDLSGIRARQVPPLPRVLIEPGADRVEHCTALRFGKPSGGGNDVW